MGLFDNLFKSKPAGDDEGVVEAARRITETEKARLLEAEKAEKPLATKAPASGNRPAHAPVARAYSPRSLGQSLVPPARALSAVKAGTKTVKFGASGERGRPQEIRLFLDDVLPRIPPDYLNDSPRDGRKEIRFRVEDVTADIARGRASVALVRIAEQAPEIFRAPVPPHDETLIRLPLQKLVEQIGFLPVKPPAEGTPHRTPPIVALPAATVEPAMELKAAPPVFKRSVPPALESRGGSAPPDVAPQPVEPPPSETQTPAPVPAVAAQHATYVPPSLNVGVKAPEPSAIRASEFSHGSVSSDAKVSLSLVAVLKQCPKELICAPLPPITEADRITLAYSSIDKQVPTGQVEISSVRFVFALPQHLQHCFEAREGIRVWLPIDEILRNLPGSFRASSKTNLVAPAQVSNLPATPSPSVTPDHAEEKVSVSAEIEKGTAPALQEAVLPTPETPKELTQAAEAEGLPDSRAAEPKEESQPEASVQPAESSGESSSISDLKQHLPWAEIIAGKPEPSQEAETPPVTADVPSAASSLPFTDTGSLDQLVPEGEPRNEKSDELPVEEPVTETPPPAQTQPETTKLESALPEVAESILLEPLSEDKNLQEAGSQREPQADAATPEPAYKSPTSESLTETVETPLVDGQGLSDAVPELQSERPSTPPENRPTQEEDIKVASNRLEPATLASSELPPPFPQEVAAPLAHNEGQAESPNVFATAHSPESVAGDTNSPVASAFIPTPSPPGIASFLPPPLIGGARVLEGRPEVPPLPLQAKGEPDSTLNIQVPTRFVPPPVHLSPPPNPLLVSPPLNDPAPTVIPELAVEPVISSQPPPKPPTFDVPPPLPRRDSSTSPFVTPPIFPVPPPVVMSPGSTPSSRDTTHVDPPPSPILPVRSFTPQVMRPLVAPPPLFGVGLGEEEAVPEHHAPMHTEEAVFEEPAPPTPLPPPLPLELGKVRLALRLPQDAGLDAVGAELTRLPGLHGCLLTVRHEASDIGELAPGFDPAAARSLAGRLAQSLAGDGADSIGTVQHLTVFAGDGCLSVFARGNAVVCALHRTRAFLPGVCEKLTAAADALADA